jgi:glycosyltransferase involved in cell wall biosynthesis
MLEAMACDVPVVASNTSTSPEILGDDEGTFDPFDPRDIARVLEATLADEALMARLRERSRRRVAHYTWHRVAEQSLVGYERALATGRRRPRSVRPRLALYTPWPPDRSGIASYNLRLVAELGRHVDVDVVVGGELATYPEPREPGTRIVGASEMGWKAPLRSHDALLYCMGNSSFHGYVYEAMAAERGVVVAHDVRLTGFYGWYAGQERPSDPTGRLSERIAAMYGARLGTRTPFADRPPTPAEQEALGIYMSHELQEYAHKIIVHSRYAAEVLRLDSPYPHGPRPDLAVLPHAFAERPPRPPRPHAPKAPLVVTFGVVSSVKNPQVLIEAFALVQAERPGARLVFAGGADPAELDRWRDVAAAAGIGECVDFLDHVDEPAWEELLTTADLAVQLRLVSNGEASGTVCECLSAGLPVIVTDQGWFGELPDAAVGKVTKELTAPVLATAMATILDDPAVAEAMAQEGLAYARANSFAAVAHRYLQELALA